jgi:hypothetical protein
MTHVLVGLAAAIVAHSPAAKTDSAQMTIVTIENTRTVPVTVYVEEKDRSMKLGVVGALADSTIRIPNWMVRDGKVRFFLDPRGEPEEATELLALKPGERLGVEIPPRSK